MGGISAESSANTLLNSASDLDVLSKEDLVEFGPAIRHRFDELPKLHPKSRRHLPHADYGVKERILKLLDSDQNDGPELAQYDAQREYQRTVIDPD